MDEDVGVGAGPAERATHAGGGGPRPPRPGRGARPPPAGGGGPAPPRRRRMSAGRKREAVLRLLRGEDLELVSRELGVTAARPPRARSAPATRRAASPPSAPRGPRPAPPARPGRRAGRTRRRRP